MASFIDATGLATLISKIKEYAMAKAGGTFMGNVTMNDGATLTVNTPTADGHAATKAYVDSVAGTADAMVYKGTLGTGGSTSTLPDNAEKGWTYKVVTAGTYASQAAKVGDIFIAKVTNDVLSWDLVPSGNEDTTSVSYTTTRANINVSTTADTGNKVFGDTVTKTVATSISNSSDDNTLPTSKAVYDALPVYTATGALTVTNKEITHNTSSLVTTGDSKTISQGAKTPAFGETAAISTITIDKYGHVISEGSTTITIPNSVATSSAKGLVKSADSTNGDITVDSNGYMTITAITTAEINALWA